MRCCSSAIRRCAPGCSHRPSGGSDQASGLHRSSSSNTKGWPPVCRMKEAAAAGKASAGTDGSCRLVNSSAMPASSSAPRRRSSRATGSRADNQGLGRPELSLRTHSSTAGSRLAALSSQPSKSSSREKARPPTARRRSPGARWPRLDVQRVRQRVPGAQRGLHFRSSRSASAKGESRSPAWAFTNSAGPRARANSAASRDLPMPASPRRHHHGFLADAFQQAPGALPAHQARRVGQRNARGAAQRLCCAVSAPDSSSRASCSVRRLVPSCRRSRSRHCAYTTRAWAATASAVACTGERRVR